MAITREEYSSYKRLRDFLHPSNRSGFIVNPLVSKQVPRGMQRSNIPREVVTPFKEAVATANKSSIAGAGIRTVGRTAGVVVGIAGAITAAYDFVTTSPNEQVAKGFYEAMDQCAMAQAHLLPASSKPGFINALKKGFPLWAMNLGVDDIGRMVDKNFDQKFMQEFQSGMQYIHDKCPSVWNGIVNSQKPDALDFRQGILEWIGRIPEIHGPLKIGISAPPPWKWNISIHGLDWVGQ